MSNYTLRAVWSVVDTRGGSPRVYPTKREALEDAASTSVQYTPITVTRHGVTRFDRAATIERVEVAASSLGMSALATK